MKAITLKMFTGQWKQRNKDIKIKDKIRYRLLVMGQAIKTLDPTFLASGFVYFHSLSCIFDMDIVHIKSAQFFQVTAKSTGGRACCSNVWRRGWSSVQLLHHFPPIYLAWTHLPLGVISILPVHIPIHTNTHTRPLGVSDSGLNLFGDCLFIGGWGEVEFFCC